MITGNSLIDNELNKVTEEIKKSLKTSETEQNELFIKLKRKRPQVPNKYH